MIIRFLPGIRKFLQHSDRIKTEKEFSHFEQTSSRPFALRTVYWPADYEVNHAKMKNEKKSIRYKINVSSGSLSNYKISFTFKDT